MSLSYDLFAGEFLAKIIEYDFINIDECRRSSIIDGYLRRALVAFKKNCRYDLLSNMDDRNRIIDVDVAPEDVDEIVDIVSEGMVVQWMKPFVYKQENLENVLNTKDFTTYSPAELLMRIGNAYASVQKDYKQMIREYSYNHGHISEYHL